MTKRQTRLTCSRIDQENFDYINDISNVITSNKINSVEYYSSGVVYGNRYESNMCGVIDWRHVPSVNYGQ